MDEIEIRRLGPEQAELYRAVRMEALARCPEAFASTLEIEAARPPEAFAERLRASAVFAAFEGAEPLGMAGFYRHDTPKMAHKGVLWGMYVRPEARGRRIARRLVEAVIAHAAAEVEVLQLAVTTSNAAARALYAGLGFVEYGIEPRSLKSGDVYWDDVLMFRRLGG